MKASRLLCGLAIAVPSVIAGMLANEFVFAQEKEVAPSEWKYKIVELEYEIPEGHRTELRNVVWKHHAHRRVAVEGILNKNGADGWELVTYFHTEAAYRKRVKPSPNGP